MFMNHLSFYLYIYFHLYTIMIPFWYCEKEFGAFYQSSIVLCKLHKVLLLQMSATKRRHQNSPKNSSVGCWL